MGNYESKGKPFIAGFTSSYIHESDVNDEKRLGQISIYSKVTDSNDFVAVKKYPKQTIPQLHTFQLFYTQNGQFVGTAQNEHPNITRLHAYDISADQQITLYLEYCHTTIRDQIDLRAQNALHFSSEELWRTALSVIMAGYFLELQGRFIGDVNTKRIFLTKKGIVKVVPCMQSQRDTDCLQRAGFFGDHCYLPPELLARLKRRDLLSGNTQNLNKADVFGLGLSLLEMATLKDSAELIDWETFEIFDMQVSQRIESTRDRYGDYFVQLLLKMLRNEDQLRSSFAQLFTELLPFQQVIITGVGFNSVSEFKGQIDSNKDGNNNNLGRLKQEIAEESKQNNDIIDSSTLNNFDRIISKISKTEGKRKEPEDNLDKNIPGKIEITKKKDCFSVHHNNNKTSEDDPYQQLSAGTNSSQKLSQLQPSSSQFINKNSLANVWLNNKNINNPIKNSNISSNKNNNPTNVVQSRTIKSLTQHTSPLYGAPLSKEILSKSPIKVENNYTEQYPNFSQTISSNADFYKPAAFSTLENSTNITPNPYQFPAFQLHQNVELTERKSNQAKEQEEEDKLAETIPGSSSGDNAFPNSYNPPWAASFPSEYQTFQQNILPDNNDNNNNTKDTAVNDIQPQHMENPAPNETSQLPTQVLQQNVINIPSNANNLELNSSLCNNQSSTSANLLKYQNLLHAQESSYLADQLQQQQQFSYANTQFTDRSAIQHPNPSTNWNNVFTLNDISNYNFENSNKEKIGVQKDNHLKVDRTDINYDNISNYDASTIARDDVSRHNNIINNNINYDFKNTTNISQMKTSTTPYQINNPMNNTQPTSSSSVSKQQQYSFGRAPAYSNHTYQYTTPASNNIKTVSNTSSRCSNPSSHTPGAVVNVQDYLKTPVPVKKIALNLLLQPFNKPINQPQIINSNQSNSSLLSTSTRSIAQQEIKIILPTDEYLQPQRFPRGMPYARSISPSSVVVRRSITPVRQPALMNTVVVVSCNASPVVVPRLKQQIGSVKKEDPYFYQPQKQIIDLSRSPNVAHVTGFQQNNYSFHNNHNSSLNNGVILQGTGTQQQQQPSPIALPGRLIKSNSSLRVMLSR